MDNKVVLIAENCFPSLLFLLNSLQERYGFQLRTVPNDNIYFSSNQAFIDAWDEDVALAILTWVSSTTPNRIDLKKMVAHAKTMRSLTCADITQGAGIIPINLAGLDVDFAVALTIEPALIALYQDIAVSTGLRHVQVV